VDNATVNATGLISVGHRSTGSMNVRNGAAVTVPSLFVGEAGNSATDNSSVTVESNGHLQVSGAVFLENGRLTINGGSADRAAGTPGIMFLAGTGIFSSGLLEVVKGHYHDEGLVNVNGTLTIDRNNGSVSVGRDVVEIPGQITVTPLGLVNGSGIIHGKLVTQGGSQQFGGTISPGNSPGTLTIDGDYEQDGGLLKIEMAGTLPAQFDVLAVTGNAMLGGTLSLDFIDGFVPHAGDAFTFLNVAGSTVGNFADILVHGLEDGWQYQLTSVNGALTLLSLNDGVAMTPEPASLMLLGLGGGLVLLRRERGK